MSQDVLEAADGDLAWIRLNRPARGNSVTPEVVLQLRAAVDRAAADDTVRAVVLTGTGSVFCAGADVQEMHQVYAADGADGLADYLGTVWMPAVQRLVRTIWYTPKPIVAAFNGAATAGGLDFGLACDVRAAADTARFAESYINLGMVPVAGGAFLLPLAVGLAAATDLLTSGRFIDAPRSAALGLVQAVCPDTELPGVAAELARSLSRGPSASFAHIKRISRNSYEADFEAALDSSLAANIDLIAQDEVRAKIVQVMERYSVAHS